jgi:hypothetical protein
MMTDETAIDTACQSKKIIESMPSSMSSMADVDVARRIVAQLRP